MTSQTLKSPERDGPGQREAFSTGRVTVAHSQADLGRTLAQTANQPTRRAESRIGGIGAAQQRCDHDECRMPARR
jgi:hypothetical protein